MRSRNDTHPQTRVGQPVFADGERVLHEMQEIVGRKWHPVVVYRLLRDGPTGFSGLKDRIDGVSSKMLSQALTDLDEAGLVERDQVSDSPVRVEYALTERGRALEPVIAEMLRWGSEHSPDRGNGRECEHDRDDPAEVYG